MENEGKIVPLHPENEKSRDDILLECAKMATLVGYVAIMLDDPELTIDDDAKAVVMEGVYGWMGCLTKEEEDEMIKEADNWRQVREIFRKAFDEMKEKVGANDD